MMLVMLMNLLQRREAPMVHVDTNWYVDTGASDHITGEPNKLHTQDYYKGSCSPLRVRALIMNDYYKRYEAFTKTIFSVKVFSVTRI